MFEEIQLLHEKQYLILKELKRVCDKNDLKYYLAFGTLLGAVRHQGFIPWDDDIDVGMPIEDCKKLESIFLEGGFGNEFFLQTPKTDKNSGATFFKLRLNNTTFITRSQANRDMHHGIDIDIYPLYNVSDNGFMRWVQTMHAILYLLFEYGEVPKSNGGVMKMGGAILLKIFSGKHREKIKEHCLRYMGRYEGKKTKYKAHFYGNLNRCRRIYPAEIFNDVILMKFEDEEFNVPVGYDYFLSKFYGDYMKMPPLENQGIKFDKLVKIDTEHSYLDYKGIYYCVKEMDDEQI